jgi:hypothetical protein
LEFEEGLQREYERRQQAIRAAVAAGSIEARTAWPEFFAPPAGTEQVAFPSNSADMSQFNWEKPSEERAKQELDMLMHGARVTVSDLPDPAAGKVPPPVATPPPPRDAEKSLRPGPRRMPPPPGDLSALEWP